GVVDRMEFSVRDERLRSPGFAPPIRWHRPPNGYCTAGTVYVNHYCSESGKTEYRERLRGMLR
ncbi:MAG: hypothetical protein DWQ34_09430, partial [Planctomycetota bacterium]